MDKMEQLGLICFCFAVVMVIAAIAGCIVGAIKGRKEHAAHVHNMAWPFRIVQTNADEYRVEQYAFNGKYWEWVEANRFKVLLQADTYCVENMTRVMKSRLNTITSEEREDMRRRNEKVKKVIDMSGIEQTVRENCAGSDESIAYVTSEAYLAAHGGK